jgi:hypothetical protein
MENKKQLIIIPPVSEAMKKLQEVLEGISVDENMEITVIDDLKEFGQFLNITGQCLILVSNAKKCATLLQENRAYLIKNHCKTILFTPKEIPAKTLVKFTKIGLTESILENSPPKTFLYKVKLLLRSIKTAKNIDDAEKTVKSLDNMQAQVEGHLELKGQEKDKENSIDLDRTNKKNQMEGETIDYGNPLKGKIKPATENLDTHWKSDQKKSAENLIEEEEEKDLSLESTPDAIDMYMRGKNKNIDASTKEEDKFDKKMAELLADDEQVKKKKSFEDIIDDGSMKQKRLKPLDTETIEEIKKPQTTIELDIVSTKNKKSIGDEVDDFDKKMAELLAAEAEMKKKNKGFIEELGGHLKGKVSELIPEEDIDELLQKKTYDNSEIQEEKASNIELDLIAAKKEKTKKGIEALELENEMHEGQVDQIEGNMIGDEGTVEKIRTRMEGKLKYDENPIEAEEKDNLHSLKKETSAAATDEYDKNSLEQPTDEIEDKKNKSLKADSEENKKREKSIELEIEAARKHLDKKEELEAEIRERKPIVDQEANGQERKKLDKIQPPEKKSNELGLPSKRAEANANNTHTSTVDKIDTYYRGGESNKKNDQDWGNLIDKKDSVELLAGKTKRNDATSGHIEKNNLGEQTIDYRKMKEEFDMMAAGMSTNALPKGKDADASLNNDEDVGSFKVVDIDPKGLDFSINIINSIYQKEIKPKNIFSLLTEELLNTYHCIPIFYNFKLTEKKFVEAFNPFIEIKDDRISREAKDLWVELKKDNPLFEKFLEKSMITWRCPEIVKNNEVWEDVELPIWAENELKTKKVELIFPYYDGIDRMGMAIVFFPEGLDPKTANGLLTVLETARTLFLDTIQRYQVPSTRAINNLQSSEAMPIEEKKNVLSFFGGLFGKKKTG